MSFSVLISVYDKEDPSNLDECLNSILRQTLKPDEIVLVEDGQLNIDLIKIINFYKKKIKIKSYPLKNNVGLGAALNYGLAFCKFNYIVRVDSDDINLPNRFKKLINKLDEGFYLVGSQIKEFDKKGFKKIRKVPVDYEDIKIFAKRRNPFNHMSVAFRKDKILNVGAYPNYRFKQDYFLWIKMISNYNLLTNINEVLVYARSDDNLILRRGGIDYALTEISLQKELLREGISTLYESFYYGAIRMIVFLMPSFLRKMIFKFFLRETD